MARRLLSLACIGVAFVASLMFASMMFADTAQAQRRGIPINIQSVPPGATVYLDSTSNPPLGTTPLSSVRVASGSHTLIFQLALHEEARLPVTVRRRRETFRAVLRALGTVEVSAANEAAQGANVVVDGRPSGQLGPTPVRATDLQPGRHHVRVERQGYQTFEQWIDVTGGQVVRVSAMLERQAPNTGEILVVGPTGAPIFLDGTASGTTPTVLDRVPVGSHTVEIRPAGQPPYSQQVIVLSGQRANVAMPQSSGATLRVLATAAGAVISIDGEVIGPSPAVREGLGAGEHIVEATAEGYEPARETVTLEGGRNRVISLTLQRAQGEPGRVMVRANVPGARVIIDGQERGEAPVVYSPEAGPHTVIVRAEGRQEFSTTCETGPGRNCEVDADLRTQQVRVTVAVQPGVRAPIVYLDNDPLGPVPYDGTVPAGSHRLTVRAPGYEPYTEQVLLTPSSDVRAFSISLVSLQQGMTEAERLARLEAMERERGAAVTHSAAPLPINQALIDVSVGWPYLAEVRLNVGLLEFLDAGFGFRTFGRLSEFEGRVRVGFRPLPLLSVGGQVRFGGGLGPEFGYARPLEHQVVDPADASGPRTTCNWDMATAGSPECPSDAAAGGGIPLADRINSRPTRTEVQSFSYPVNTAYFMIELLASLHFSDQGAFTLWLALDLSSDEYAGHPLNSSAFLDYAPNATDTSDRYCDVVAGPTRLSCPREDFARARLGGSLELVLARNWNLWFLLEGILSSQPRRVLGNLIGIEAGDTQFYFRLGTTFKF